MSKITVAEWIAFLNEPWPEDQWTDDTLITVDGVEIVSEIDMEKSAYAQFPLSAVVRIEAGNIRFDEIGRDDASLKSAFLAWRKARTTAIIVVEIESSKADALKLAIKSNGGKIVS